MFTSSSPAAAAAAAAAAVASASSSTPHSSSHAVAAAASNHLCAFHCSPAANSTLASRSQCSSPSASSIVTTESDQSIHSIGAAAGAAATLSGGGPEGGTAEMDLSDGCAAAAAGSSGASASLQALSDIDRRESSSSPSAHMFGDGDDSVTGDECVNKHVLLVVTTMDPFISYISVGEQEFHKADLAELLLDNPILWRYAIALDSHSPSKELLEWRQQQKNLSAAAAATIDHLPLGEFKQMLLFLLLRLHQRASESRLAWNVRVSILCKCSLFQPMLARLPTESPAAAAAKPSKQSQAAWASLTQTAQGAWSSFHSSAFHRLHVRPRSRKTAYRGATRSSSAKPQSAHSARDVNKSSRFAYRFVTELPSDLPIDVLYLPNLMWFGELAPQEHLKSAVDQLLRDIGPSGLSASLYPPLLWDHLCEQKQNNHTAFADCMIPCEWIALRSLQEEDIRLLAEQLWNAATSAPLPAGATENLFMLKAAWGYSKNCVEQLKPTSQGKEATVEELRKRITKCAQVYHQRIFTMQPYFASLAAKEFRIWCVAADCVLPNSNGNGALAAAAAAAAAHALPSAPSRWKRWRIVTGVQSCFVAGSTLLCAEVVSPYDPLTFAVWQFVEDLFLTSAHKSYFDRLLDEGMPAVRIDCFHCVETGRVMLNEITSPPDAMMFTHKHGLPMIKGVSYTLADGLFAELA